MPLTLLALLGLLGTPQAAGRATRPKMFERDVIAAMQDYVYRYNLQDVPIFDVGVTVHAHTAYAYASAGVDGRGALLRMAGGSWFVVGGSKGQFSSNIFTDVGVSPQLANIAVQTTCPPLRLTWRKMTPDERKLAKHSYAMHVSARRVRDLNGRWYLAGPIDYRVCSI